LARHFSPTRIAGAFRRNAPLNEPDRSTFYAPGAKGYIGYPTFAA